jgi:transmembrane sensor
MTPEWSDEEIGIIDRYLAGDASYAEEVRARALLAGEPESAARYRRAVAVVRETDVSAPDGRVMWRRFHGELSGRYPAAHIDPGSARKPLGSRVVIGGVVGALLAASAMLVVVRFGVPRADTHPTTHTYVTHVAERVTVALGDGSQAVLAPGSRLVFRDDGKQMRVAELDGEAYFTVAANTERAFVVQTGAVTTRVLGTAFNVRRYANDASAYISVVTGKVRVGSTMGLLVVTPGLTVRATDSTVNAVAGDDARGRAAWTEGRLVFNDTPVPVMLETVGRWYGYTFHLKDSVLTKRHVTTTLTIDQRTTTLRLIQDLLDVTMTFDGTAVLLRPNRDATHAIPPAKARGRVTNFTSREVGR